MKIFITGGTGFIGSHFLQAALDKGHEIIALRRPGSRTRIPLSHEPCWVEGELRDDWSAQLAGCDALLHLAAAGVSSPTASWLELFQINVHDSLRLWLAAVQAGVSRLAICGSCFEYGRSGEKYDFIPPDAPLEPTGAYHASKAAATMAALAVAYDKNAEVIVLRPFHVFGEGEEAGRFWPSLRAAAKAGTNFPMSAGEQIRDFTPVEYAVDRFLDALERPLVRGCPLIVNVGTGQPQTLRNFAEYWWDFLGAKGQLLFGAVPYRANEVMCYTPLI